MILRENTELMSITMFVYRIHDILIHDTLLILLFNILQGITKSNLLNFILLLISRIRQACTCFSCSACSLTLPLHLLHRLPLFQPPKAKITLVQFFTQLLWLLLLLLLLSNILQWLAAAADSLLSSGELNSVQFSQLLTYLSVAQCSAVQCSAACKYWFYFPVLRKSQTMPAAGWNTPTPTSWHILWCDSSWSASWLSIWVKWLNRKGFVPRGALQLNR